MSWNLSGDWFESCSCKMVCRCTLGPTEPDQGWCSHAYVMRLAEGRSDGIDLGGTKVALAMDLPGDFTGPIDVARLYIDERTSEQQRRELEAIFTGQRGGIWAGINQAVQSWLAPKIVSIVIDDGTNPEVTVGDVGWLRLTPLRTADGKQATLLNAPVVAAGLGVDTVELHLSEGTTWSDPDMRHWESLGFGGRVKFSWSA